MEEAEREEEEHSIAEIVLIFVVARPGPQLCFSYNLFKYVGMTVAKSLASPGILT